MEVENEVPYDATHGGPAEKHEPNQLQGEVKSDVIKAVAKIHQRLGHPTRELKISGAPKETIDCAKEYQCPVYTKRRHQINRIFNDHDSDLLVSTLEFMLNCSEYDLCGYQQACSRPSEGSRIFLLCPKVRQALDCQFRATILSGHRLGRRV